MLKFDNNYESKLAIGAGVIGSVLIFASRYKVSTASQYLVRTGLGIKNIKISKTGFLFPFQKHNFLDVSPITFDVEIDAMSSERIPFRMPTVWTIAPDTERLSDYAQLLSEKNHIDMVDTIRGVIQGETRILTAKLKLDDLFQSREHFKNEVTENIGEVIKPLGLRILNANISELSDIDKNNLYFDRQKQRALKQVDELAKVHISEAVKDGETGEARNKTEARVNVAESLRIAILKENEQQNLIEESAKNLDVAKLLYSKEREIARRESDAEPQRREAELQREVEKAKAEQDLERRRATELTKAKVDYEIKLKNAQAEFESAKLLADADYYQVSKKADGILAIKQAEAKGLQSLIDSAGNVDGLVKYMMLNGGVLQELADKNAQAIQGLNPNITIWNADSNKNSQFSDTVQNLVKNYDAIKQTTGFDVLELFKSDKSREKYE
jgi:flotillin